MDKFSKQIEEKENKSDDKQYFYTKTEHQSKTNSKSNERNDKLTPAQCDLFWTNAYKEKTLNATIFSPIPIFIFLILIRHYYTLPAQNWWLYSDPVVLSTLKSAACYLADLKEKKFTPYILLIVGLIYNYYPLLESICYNYWQNAGAIFLLTFLMSIAVLISYQCFYCW